MQALFSPAVALMNRLRFTHKFALMGVVITLAIVLLIGTLFRTLDANLEASRAELRGLAVVKPMQQLIQYVQQHRGLAGGVLAGNAAMQEKRVAKAAEVAATLRALEAVAAPELLAGARWKGIVAEWKQLEAAVLGWTGVESFDRHTALIANILSFLADVSDHYALTLDPDVDSFYLIDTMINRAPYVLERFGQMRAKGTPILTKK